MKDEYGINKAALGVRYLIKYIETGNQENFNIVMDCLKEVELWCLITSFCNNIDELFDTVPDFALDNIFTTRNVERMTFEEAYGKGFKSNSNMTSKEQFSKIRNLLAHRKFKYEKGIITVFDKEFEAIFDIKWLKRLTSVTLSNERLGLKKGMSDISIMSLAFNTNIETKELNKNMNDISIMPLAFNANMDVKELKENIEQGIISFYKVTALSGNKQNIVDSMSLKVITPEELTFETIFQTAITIMESKIFYIYATPEENKKQLKKHFKEIEETFGNKIKVESTKIEITDELLNDEEFKELTLNEKLEYLVRTKRLDDPVRYNGTMLQNLLELFDSFKEGKFENLNIFTLRNSKEFLLKVYANIFFTGTLYQNSGIIAKNNKIFARYVHAVNIYKEYLKVLKKSYEELEILKGSKFSKKYIYELMKQYSKLLEESLNGDAYEDFSWKMRNSIIHNQVEFKEGYVRFYTTGKTIKINRFNKKHQKWEIKEFNNNRTIWEMTCSMQELIELLDELYKEKGIEIKVNIHKYTMRKDYLRNFN